MWTIWRECNWQTFEDVESTRSQLLATFISSLYKWSQVWGFTNNKPIMLFMESLFYFIFLISKKDSLISKEKGTQVHRKYIGVNKSRTEITKVK